MTSRLKVTSRFQVIFSQITSRSPSNDAREIIEDAIGFDKFTQPMQQLIRDAAAPGNGTFFVCSARPRLVDGKPSKNPRYLQLRPDLVNPRDAHLAEIGARLRRRVPLGKPIQRPVNAVLPGRRNNPPEGEIRPLAVFNPIHYLELPELFMEFICSVTGRSPSTTGAGSEGALTKGPFNALPPIIDLNAALVSYLLTGDAVFVTATGYVGPRFRVDHDISLLVPEIWSRMSVAERDPQYLISEGHLERCTDFEYDGRTIRASRLGYRITMRFVLAFFGQMFNHPAALFTEEMLRPELQDRQIFVDGLDNIISTQKTGCSALLQRWRASIWHALHCARFCTLCCKMNSRGRASIILRFARYSLAKACLPASGMPNALRPNRRSILTFGIAMFAV